MSRRKTADVVVIGGGVVGTAVTYFLAKKNLDVVLVEKGSIAGGTSGRCDGNVLLQDKMPGYDSQLNKLSLDLFPQIAEELDYDIGWSCKGSLLVAENEAEMEAATIHSERMVEQSLPFRVLDRKEIHDDEPNLAEDIVGGLEVACDGSLNPMALAYGLAHGAKRLGAETRTGTPVTDIRLDRGGCIQKVVTEEGEILSNRVVNAAGVWAPEIGSLVGVDIPIRPRQGQLLVTERTFPIAKRKVVEFGYLMAKFETEGYKRNVTPDMERYGIAFVFEPTEAKNFLIGSSRRFVGMDKSSHLGVLRAMAQRAIRFYPAIKEVKIIRSYAGVRPYTPDHLPIISETEIPGFFLAAGHEGDGIGLSLITGKLVSQMICNEPLDITIEPLRLRRFQAEGENSVNAH